MLSFYLLGRCRPYLYEVGDPSNHAANLGTVRKNPLTPDAPQPEGPQGATVLRLGPDARANLLYQEVGLTGVGRSGPSFLGRRLLFCWAHPPPPWNRSAAR